MRESSDKTEVRRLRSLLRRCGQAMVFVTAFEFGGSASHGLDRQRALVKALAPKRRARRARREVDRG